MVTAVKPLPGQPMVACLSAPCTCVCLKPGGNLCCATQVKAGAQTPFCDHIIMLHLRIIFLCCSLFIYYGLEKMEQKDENKVVETFGSLDLKIPFLSMLVCDV